MDNYENMHNALIREVNEICTSKAEVCNDMTHANIVCEWNKMLKVKKKKERDE